jgi:hypothetical protein
MQTELQQLRASSKVNEERVKLIEADKHRLETQYSSQLKSLEEKKEQI